MTGTGPRPVTAAALVTAAERLAADVLLPSALATDRAPLIAASVLDAIADAGLYGLTAPTAVGGAGADRATIWAVVEALAGGCLTATFIWVQHLGVAAMVGYGSGPVHEEWSRPLAAGTARAGVAFAHLRRPDPPPLVATAHPDGWAIDGTAPWVTGWGRIDVVSTAARRGSDIVWLLVDAVESPTLRTEILPLAAIQASGTVTATFSGHLVPASRVIAVEPLTEFLTRDALGLRSNGSLALGVAARALLLLGPSALDTELARARRALDAAGPDRIADARAAATVLAVRAATALVAASGGRGVVLDSHAQRLAREAMFLMVQGQTAAIRAEQIARLTAP